MLVLSALAGGVVAVAAPALVFGQSVPWSSFAAGVPAGADVTVPAGSSVLFDVGRAEVGELVVRGELVFEDDEPIELVASRIIVTGDGAALRAGSFDAPFVHDLTITLTELIGDPAVQPMMGYRVLGVRDGASLQLHGASRQKTSWTQISGDLGAGATTLSTLVPTGWAPGDVLAVAPSGEDARHAERVTVVSVDGASVEFTPALTHPRLGRVFTYAGKEIDMRAEVGLLSRNIVIRSAADDPADDLGFHTMVMPDAGAVNLSGVEFVGGGQLGRPARYPMHWHRDPRLEVQIGSQGWQIEAPSRAGDWLRGCSIHSSGQRGVVVHGVNDLVIEDTVVFDVWSHAFVTSEDGLEKNNTFRRNLAMLVKRQPNDRFAFPRTDHTESDQAEHRPSGFWGRNPFNPLVGNHAAGTVEGIGFFIDSQVMSYDMKRLIEREHGATETLVFTNNLAHSNYREGVAGAGIPTYGPKTRGHGLMVGDYTAKFDAVFEGFRTYRNSVLGVWIEDDRHTLRDAVLTDSSGGLIALRSNIEDVVFNQRSDNTLGREPQNMGNRRYPGGGLHLQSAGYGNHANLRGVTFMNVEPAAVYMWQDPLGSSAGTTLEGITLVNTRAVLHSSDPGQVDSIYTDLDGSLVGMGAGALIGGDNLLARGGVFVPELGVVVVPGACSAADLAGPFGSLTFADLSAFIAAFEGRDPAADLAAPTGSFTLADVSAFLAAFTAGCP